MTCGQCTHANIKDSPMKQLGFALCRKEKGIYAMARTYSAKALCNKDGFQKKVKKP